MDLNNNFIQSNSLDGEFLQSNEWRKFQEATGKKTFNISTNGFWANIIEHNLPVVGKYFYIPRGPIFSITDNQETSYKQISNSNNQLPNFLEKILDLAKKEKAGWIRVEPASEDMLNLLRPPRSKFKITKAPHDMQPKEVFIIDITKSEEELLAEMKSKTRYNIKVAQKHDVKISVADNLQPDSQKYLEKFLELIKITAKRDGITPHPENHYRKMFETIPAENLKLYVAEYENKIITANIVVHYGNTATYLHGASDNNYRNVMAPYLLQWQAIQDAKKSGLEKYDFGGVKTGGDNSWAGITKFKTGFSPNVKPIEFPGSYDIVVNPVKYNLYRIIQKIKSIL